MAAPPVLRIPTPGFAGYSVSYNPFFPGKLACASSSNFGLVGNGRLHVIDVDLQSGRGGVGKTFDTQDGIFDLAWSELHENQIATGGGDGSVKLWDVMLKDFPLQSWVEHTREVFSVDWNNIRKEIFASSSWDTLIKIWSP
ncbi:WD40 repeat-like protein, partial [Atractiella rhizophila]